MTERNLFDVCVIAGTSPLSVFLRRKLVLIKESACSMRSKSGLRAEASELLKGTPNCKVHVCHSSFFPLMCVATKDGLS